MISYIYVYIYIFTYSLFSSDSHPTRGLTITSLSIVHMSSELVVILVWCKNKSKKGNDFLDFFTSRAEENLSC